MRRSQAGARDNNTYRSNVIAQNLSTFWPIAVSSISYEGILNEYSFGIGEEFECLFKTSYSCAISK